MPEREASAQDTGWVYREPDETTVEVHSPNMVSMAIMAGAGGLTFGVLAICVFPVVATTLMARRVMAKR